MSRMGTLTRRALAVVSLVAAAIAFSVAAPKPAQAAGEVGYFDGATVYCDSATNRLDVTARFGRSPSFSSQEIAYSHYLINIDTGAGTQLLANGGGQFTRLIHNQPFYGLQWTVHNVDLTYYTVPNGRYRLYTMYAWFNVSWTYRGWREAAHYYSRGDMYSWGAETFDCTL